MTSESSPSRWAELTADGSSLTRFAAMEARAAAMERPHGEADLVHALAPTGRILDAGCGTGRVTARLAELGHPVVGVDADLEALKVAADRYPKIPFWLSDLAELDLPQGAVFGGFDLVLLAGNVVPLLAPGTLEVAIRELFGVTKPGGTVVAGFGLDAAHLPPGCPVTTLETYDAACGAAGLRPVDRFGTWERGDFTGDYVVRVHRR